MKIDKIIADDSDYKKEKKKKNLITLAVVGVIILTIGAIVGVTLYQRTDRNENKYHEANKEDRNLNTVSGNQYGTNDGNKTKITYDCIQSGLKITETEYKEYSKLGQDSRQNSYNKKNLVNLLCAMAYQYEWSEEIDEKALTPLDEFLQKNRDFVMYIAFEGESQYNALYDTMDAYRDNHRDEDIKNILDNFVGSGYEKKTKNEIAYGIYKFYLKGLETGEAPDYFLNYASKSSNYPEVNLETAPYLSSLKYFNAIASFGDLNQTGYLKYSHVLPLNEEEFIFYDTDGKAKIKSSYAVPIISMSDDEKATKQIHVAFLDDTYNVIDILKWNDSASNVSSYPFIALLER